MSRIKYIVLIILATSILMVPMESIAQCPMCRMAVESNLQNGGTQARGLNNGILYMLAMPYLLISTLAFLWYKNRRKEVEEF
jgi:hypothetical protein